MRIIFYCSLLALLAVATALPAGCQSTQDQKYKDAMALIDKPINCATAEGDIRVLESEKAHVQDQIGAGVTSVTPIGLVVGLATGKEGQNLKISTGEYNRLIDKRIAEIKAHCGLD